MITRKARVVTAAGISVLACLLMAIYASASRLFGDDLSAQVRNALVGALQESLHRRVTVSSVDTNLSGNVTIKGLVIHAREDEPSNQPFVSIEDMRVRMSVLNLLRNPGNPMQGIQRITAKGVSVDLYGDGDGKWNISDLFGSEADGQVSPMDFDLELASVRLSVRSNGIGKDRVPVNEAILIDRLEMGVSTKGNTGFTTEFLVKSLGDTRFKGKGGYRASTGSYTLTAEGSDVDVPVLLSRLPSGTLPVSNVTGHADLSATVTGSKGSRPTIKGDAVARGVAGEYRDMPSLRVSDFNGRLRFGSDGVVFDGTTFAAGRGKWSLKGNLNDFVSPSVRMSVALDGVDLGSIPPIRDYMGWKVSGKATGALDIVGRVTKPRVNGTLDIGNGTVLVPQIPDPINGINGRLNVADNTVTIDELGYTVSDNPGTLSGKVTDILNPSFELELSSRVFDTADIGRFIPSLKPLDLKGLGDYYAVVIGKANAYKIIGKATVPAGSVQGMAVNNVNAGYSWENNEFKLLSINGDAFGGIVRGHGNTILAHDGGISNEYRFSIAGNEAMDSEALVRSRFGKANTGFTLLSGPMSGSFVFRTGRETSIGGEAHITNGVLLGHSVEGIKAVFGIKGDAVEFESVTVDGQGPDAGFTAGATGRVAINPKDGYRFGITARDIRTDRLLPDRLNGLGGFEGTLSGVGPDWLIDGRVSGKDIGLAKVRMDSVKGHIGIRPHAFITNGLDLRQLDRSYSIKGSYDDRTDEVMGDLDVVRGSVRDLFTMACNLGLDADKPVLRTILGNSGNVTGKLSLAYKDRIRRFDGDIASMDISLGKEDFRASGVFTSEGDNIGFRGVSLSGRSLRGSVSGYVRSDGTDSDLVLSMSKFPTDCVATLFGSGEGVSGTVDIEGRMGGNLSSPGFEGNVTLNGGGWRGVSFDGVKADVAWTGRELAVDSLKGKIGDGRVDLKGRMGFMGKVPVVVLDGGIEGVDVQGIVGPFLGKTQYSPSGRLSGSLGIEGNLNEPRVGFKGNLKSGSVAGIVLGDGPLEFGWANGLFDIEKADLENGASRLTAAGRFDTKGELALSLQAKGFPLTSLYRNPKYPSDVNIDGDMQFSGTFADPTVALSVRRTRGHVNGIALTDVTGTLLFQNGWLEVQNANIHSSRGNVRLYGKVPMADGKVGLAGIPRLLGTINTDSAPDIQGMDVAVTLDKGSLSLLPLFTTVVESASGGDEVSVNISGSVLHPVLKGNGRISDGKIRFKAIDGSFDKVSGDFAFANNRVTISGISATGPGGSVTGTFVLQYLPSSGLGVEGKLHARDIRVKDPIKGRISGTIGISQVPGRPMFIHSADAVLSEAVISVPASMLAGQSGQPGKAAPGTRLSVTAWVGNDVRFRQQGIADVEIMQGDNISISGTLDKPLFEGRLNSHRGGFTYLGTSFKLTEATLEVKPDTNGGADAANKRVNRVGNMEFQGEVKGETMIKKTRVFITLTVSGEGFDSELRSSPPMADREIRSLLSWPSKLEGLSGGGLEAGITDEVQALLVDQVRQYFVGGVEDAFRNALGLDEFKVEPSTQDGYQVSLGKYVNERVFVTYTNSLGADPLRNLRVDYTLKPGIYLSAQVDNKSDFRLFLDTQLRF